MVAVVGRRHVDSSGREDERARRRRWLREFEGGCTRWVGVGLTRVAAEDGARGGRGENR